MKAEVRINALWRRYTGLYPEELRGFLRREMARLLVRPDAETLSVLTGAGMDCGGHATVLAGFREVVTRYWQSRDVIARVLEGQYGSRPQPKPPKQPYTLPEVSEQDREAAPVGFAAVKASLRGQKP